MDQEVALAVDSPHQDSFDRMINFYNDLVDADQSRAMIQELLQRGQSRTPQAFDLFMHPEYAFRGNWEKMLQDKEGPSGVIALRTAQTSFLRAIREQMRMANPLIVVAQGPHALSPFSDEYADADRLRSVASGFNLSGRLTLEEFTRLGMKMDGLNPQDKLRIHGADFNACPKDLALQWFAASHLGQFHPLLDQSAFDDILADWQRELIEIEGILPALIEQMKLVRTDTHVRLGHVFDCHRDYSTVAKNPNSPTMQMIDGETVIYS